MFFGRAYFHTLPGKRKEDNYGEVLASHHVREALEAAVSLQHNSNLRDHRSSFPVIYFGVGRYQ